MTGLFCLQISDEEYSEITAGGRTFILSKYNSDFKVGDQILFEDLNGWNFDDEYIFTITHILKGTGKNGVKKGYCVLQIDKEFLRSNKQ